jgi:hypothetical protein
VADQYLGNGTLFTMIYTASSTTVTSTHVIGNVLSIEGPDAERESVDVTLLGSTVPWRSFKIGDGDPGTVTVQVAYDNNEPTHTALNDAMRQNSQLATFTISYNASQDPDTFQGYVIGRGRTIERNGMIQGPVTIKLSSAPGFATTT